MPDSYDNLPSGVPFFNIAYSLESLAQRVCSVDDRCDLPTFKKFFQHNQILIVPRCNKETQLLTHER